MNHDHELTNQGPLGGYCAGCGLMRIKHERTCPKCGEVKRTHEKPAPAGQIRAIGYSRFTQYTEGNEKL
jgi:uncharacterized OB-fold protein